jgi:hypothetical protein
MTFGLLIGIALIFPAIFRLIPEFPAIRGFAVHNMVECGAISCAVSPNHHGPPGSYSPPFLGTLRMRQKS